MAKWWDALTRRGDAGKGSDDSGKGGGSGGQGEPQKTEPLGTYIIAGMTITLDYSTGESGYDLKVQNPNEHWKYVSDLMEGKLSRFVSESLRSNNYLRFHTGIRTGNPKDIPLTLDHIKEACETLARQISTAESVEAFKKLQAAGKRENGEARAEEAQELADMARSRAMRPYVKKAAEIVKDEMGMELSPEAQSKMLQAFIQLKREQDQKTPHRP